MILQQQPPTSYPIIIDEVMPYTIATCLLQDLKLASMEFIDLDGLLEICLCYSFYLEFFF